MEHPRILVIGDVMLDRYQVGSVTRLSPEAPVPIISIDHNESRAGGAANVAMNVAALGGFCMLLTVTGRDPEREELLNLIKQDNIDHMAHSNLDHVTTTKTRILGGRQQLVRIDKERILPPNDVQLPRIASTFCEIVDDYDAVIMSDYGKGVLGNHDLVKKMIGCANAKMIPVFVDPRGNNYDRYAGAYAITPNLSELMDVVGPWGDESELQRKAFALRALLGLHMLVVTRGEHGMTLFVDGRDHPVSQPTVAKSVFDVSGAGDTVIATLAIAKAHGWSDVVATTAANKAAGIVVGKLGTSVVSWEELFPSVAP